MLILMRMNCKSRMLIISLILLFSAESVSALDVSPPAGWVVPEAYQLSNYLGWRNQSEKLFLSDSGDYDNDGEIDLAAIFINNSSNQEGLFVLLGGERWKLLESLKIDNTGKVFMGLKTDTPQKYDTIMCLNFEKDGKCRGGLETVADSIQYFRHGSAAKVIWWDDNQKSFQEFWISD